MIKPRTDNRHFEPKVPNILDLIAQTKILSHLCGNWINKLKIEFNHRKSHVYINKIFWLSIVFDKPEIVSFKSYLEEFVILSLRTIATLG